MKKNMLLLSISLLIGCTTGLTPEQRTLNDECPAFHKVVLANTFGVVPSAPAFFAIVESALPDGQCAVATRLLADYQETY